MKLKAYRLKPAQPARQENKASRKALKKYRTVNLRIRKYVPYSDLTNRHILKKKIYYNVQAIQARPNEKIIDIVKNFSLQSATGTELDFIKVNDEFDCLIIGAYAEIDGVPASGEFVLPDGSTLKFIKGYLKKIIKPQAVMAQANKRAYIK